MPERTATRRRTLQLCGAGLIGGLTGCSMLSTSKSTATDASLPLEIGAFQFDRQPATVIPHVLEYASPTYDEAGTLFGTPVSLTALAELHSDVSSPIDAGRTRFHWKLKNQAGNVVNEVHEELARPDGQLPAGTYTYRPQIRFGSGNITKPGSGSPEPGQYTLDFRLEYDTRGGLIKTNYEVVDQESATATVVPRAETPIVEAPTADLDGDGHQEPYLGHPHQLSLPERSEALKFTRNVLNIVAGVATGQTLPSFGVNKSKINKLAANTAQTALRQQDDGTLSLYWESQATSANNAPGVVGFPYDRAVSTVRVPDSVVVTDPGSADFVVHDESSNSRILTWFRHDVGKGIITKPSSFFQEDVDLNDPTERYDFAVAHPGSQQSIEIEFSVSLELGPFRGPPSVQYAFGYHHTEADAINSVYDYGTCLPPERFRHSLVSCS